MMMGFHVMIMGTHIPIIGAVIMPMPTGTHVCTCSPSRLSALAVTCADCSSRDASAAASRLSSSTYGTASREMKRAKQEQAQQDRAQQEPGKWDCDAAAAALDLGCVLCVACEPLGGECGALLRRPRKADTAMRPSRCGAWRAEAHVHAWQRERTRVHAAPIAHVRKCGFEQARGRAV